MMLVPNQPRYAPENNRLCGTGEYGQESLAPNQLRQAADGTLKKPYMRGRRRIRVCPRNVGTCSVSGRLVWAVS